MISYNEFFESLKDDYNILNFQDDLLKVIKYGEPQLNLIKKHSERFIGPGIYDRCYNKVISMLKSLEDVDIDYVKNILIDVKDSDDYYYNDITVNKMIAIGDLDRLHSALSVKYTKSIGVVEKNKNSLRLTLGHMLYDIVRPTIKCSDLPPLTKIKSYRLTDGELNVKDPKFNCVNYDPYEYVLFQNNDYDPPKVLKNYNVESFFNLYHPCLRIRLSGNINVKKVENEFESIINSIKSVVDVDFVVWDHGWGIRGHNDIRTVEDYNIKLMLKH